MAYKRQIAYFDYMEHGEKKGGGGFCKWEQKNGSHVLLISVSGLPVGISEKAGIYTKAGGVLGELNLRNGRAEAAYHLEEDGHDWCRELIRIQIPLSQGRELAAEFPVDETDLEIKTGILELVDRKMVQVKPEKVLALEVEPDQKGKEPEVMEQETLDYERVLEAEDSDLINASEAEPPEEEFIQEPELSEELPLHSLWDCLARTHKIVYPFGTDAEYCRIILEDIFLLKERFHILRNNQFLLHGYYNYKYLVLGKKGEDSEEYWLGVPGIYHEREKMAARMYGFEKFEGAKPRYGIGDLGYYLITVE